MGFYGNITNTSKTQFQFDRIYSNRRAMENKMYTDYVYAGRYVLIEYDSTPDIGAFSRVYMINNVAYKAIQNNSPVMDTRINKSDIDIGEIVYDIQTIDKKEKYIFYICTSEREEGNVGPATWKKIDTSDSTNSYIINYNIDIESYGPSRGYDSTVWQKVYIDGYEKYVQIAELNSVVPTFDIAADAPTAEPITPHFDINSTNVYYKLHMQPQWGFRIKENKSKDGNKTLSKDEAVYPSDETTQYTKISYDTATGNEKKTEVKYDAAIYYNKDGFNKELRTYYTPDNNVDNIDIIQISPTGVSGNEYNVHKNVYYPVGTQQPDIQELRIILPSLGNTISDIWDLIYGYNVKINADESVEITEDGIRFRDIEWKDAVTGEENYELGGMTRDLNTVAGCINKVHDLMGMIITDKSNASLNEEWFEKNYIYKEDNNYYRIHRYPLYIITTLEELDLPKRDNYNSDQEYNEAHRLAIKDKLQDKEYYLIIDSSSPNYKVRTLNEKSIAVLSDNDIIGYQNGEYGYEYLPIPDMPGKMATIYGLILQMKNLLEVEDSETRDQTTVTGAINTLNDIIAVFEDLVPGEFLICDENGHVNSANWTTAQEFKYYNHNELEPKEENKTYDTEENRWISLSLDKSKHLIELNHVFNPIEDTVTIADNNTASGNGINANNSDELKLYTPIIDSMGHVVGKNIETVTLPYGYKFFNTNGNSNNDNTDLDLVQDSVSEDGAIVTNGEPVAASDIAADKTKDTMSINPYNKWIQTKFANDELLIAHEIHGVKSNVKATNLNNDNVESVNNGDKIIVQDIAFDAAGHVVSNQEHTYTLPYSMKNVIVGKQSEAVANPEVNTDTIVAESTQDTLNVQSTNKWIRMSADAVNDTLNIGHEVHSFESGNHSIKYGLEADKTITQLDEENKFEVPVFKFDEAGHITMAETHTVTVPDNFETIKIDVSQSDSYAVNATNQSADITADTLTDTFTVAVGNRWIQLVGNKDLDKVSIYHAAPRIDSKNSTTKTGDETPDYGVAFEIPEVKYDEAGHISSIATHTVTFPTPSLNDLSATDSSVLTGISMVDGKLSITQSNANVGTRKLAEYNEGTNNGDVEATDTINAAFGKLQVQMHEEENARSNDVQNLNQLIQQEQSSRESAIREEQNTRTQAIAAINKRIDELPDYNEKWNLLEQLRQTIENQQLIIADLTTRIEALEPPVQEEENPEVEPEV